MWTIGRKLYACTGLLAVTIAAMMLTGIYAQHTIGDDVDEVTRRTTPNLQRGDELRYLTESYRVLSLINTLRAAQHNTDGIEKNRAQMQEIHERFNRTAEALTQNTGDEEIKTLARQSIVAMNEFDGNSMEIAQRAAAGKVSDTSDLTAATAKSAAKVEAIGRRIAELQAANLPAIYENANTHQKIGSTALVAMAILAFVALGVVGYVVHTTVKILTAVVTSLDSSSAHVTSAATQVAMSSQTLSQGATEQAASLEETSASMEEMASMTRKNAENAMQAARLMNEVDHVVDDSNKALHDMTTSMAGIRESSHKVSKIIKTIDEIAFQTNILALNAAVEAARAGEAGMGFAVVADEVRNLAQRSAQAAKETAVLIEESIANSQEGSTKVEVVAKSIQAITGSVGKVKGLVTEVSEASRQQSQGIDQVAHAIAQMERVTQSTAGSAEESAAVSMELNVQAETTMADITRLESLVLGTRAIDKAAKRHPSSTPVKPVGRAARLLTMPPKAPGFHRAGRTAEDEIPMGDTGTFGTF